MPKKPEPVNKPPILSTEDTLRARMIEKREELINAQKNLHDQDIGIANQLFLIDQLLNPKPPVPPEEPSKPPEEPGIM